MGIEASDGIYADAVRKVPVGKPVWETPVIEVAPMAGAQVSEAGTGEETVTS